MLPVGNRGRDVPLVSGSRGTIDSLPDEVLQHILGFLVAPDSVRTSVLARRWRHLWKFATGLRVGFLGDSKKLTVKAHREFVDHLLLLRGGSPLDRCEFRFGGFDDDDEPRVNLWVRHAMLCKVQALRLNMAFSDDRLVLGDLPLVSQHLTSLDLNMVQLYSTCLNLSSCPALKHLKLADCDLSMVKRISSKSLKHLNLSICLFDENCRTCICTPSLVSLYLDEPYGMTPILDSMPSLLEAFVETVDDDPSVGGDICDRRMDDLDCSCRLCDSSDITDSGRHSVLLEGLSQAKSLVLMSTPNKIIIKSDLRWCPIFGKLKTLLLNDCWCEPEDFNALACILEHSPVLEKLTLEIFSRGPKFKVEMKGSFNLMERSDKISEHLSIVEVKCQDVDERVLEVLKFLATFNLLAMDLKGNVPYLQNIFSLVLLKGLIDLVN